MLSLRLHFSASILALSGASRQLPQSGSHWRAGQAHARRAKPDISQTGVPCCQGQQQLDKMRLSKAIDPARTATRPRSRRFLPHSIVFRRFYASSRISRSSVILWPFQCIFRVLGHFKMHISAFLEFPAFSIKLETCPVHLILQFYYSQTPFVCQ